MSDEVIPSVAGDVVPSTPDPAIVTLVLALLRAILQLASGLGFAIGAYSDSTLTMIATAIVAAATAAWSLWEKFRAARATHAAAVASASKRTPVKPA